MTITMIYKTISDLFVFDSRPFVPKYFTSRYIWTGADLDENISRDPHRLRWSVGQYVMNVGVLSSSNKNCGLCTPPHPRRVTLSLKKRDKVEFVGVWRRNNCVCLDPWLIRWWKWFSKKSSIYSQLKRVTHGRTDRWKCDLNSGAFST